jgi:uncharacterized protein
MRHFLFVVFLFAAAFAKAQTMAEKFQHFYNAKQADSLYANSDETMKNALPLDKLKEILTQFHAQFGQLNTLVPEEGITYKGIFTNAMMKVVIATNDKNQFTGYRFLPYPPEAPKDQDNVMVNNIRGTLTTPLTNKKVPVVLLIAGSGPTDRNGNVAHGLKTNAYKQLAEALLQNNIACLRYDKRILNNGVLEQDLRFDNLVDDAAALVNYLKNDTRFSKVIIIGHSEGSLIGMLAAEKYRPDGFISLAGAGERADKLIERQLAAQASPEAAASATLLFDSLAAGHTVHATAPPLASMLRPSVQPYIISWLKYDPQLEIKKLNIPVMIVQGTTDLQVGVNDAALLKKAKPGAELKEITEMNHVLKTAPLDRGANIATYMNGDLPLHKDLTTTLVQFITKLNT